VPHASDALPIIIFREDRDALLSATRDSTLIQRRTCAFEEKLLWRIEDINKRQLIAEFIERIHEIAQLKFLGDFLRYEFSLTVGQAHIGLPQCPKYPSGGKEPQLVMSPF
jgi:hypothetical protein